MSIFEAFQWLGNTPFATELRESTLAFPLVETAHVLAIALLAGTVILVDLRLLGLVFRRTKVSEIAGTVLPLTWAGFAIMLVSGLLLFMAEAEKSYGSLAFRIKILLLFLAGLNPLLFHSTIYRSVHEWDEAAVAPWRARATAIASIVLWSGIIVAGRAIAYF